MASYDEIDTSFWIHPEGDLTITVKEDISGDIDSNDGFDHHHTSKSTSFKVKRQVLVDNSTCFKAMLSGKFRESSQSEVTLEEDTIAAMELWFRVLHNALDEDSYLISIREVWEAIEVSRKYFLLLEKLDEWFDGYWQCLDTANLSVHELKKHLFPCQAFDHAHAFAFVTKELAYRCSSQINEFSPIPHRGLHVQGRVIQQLNASRGSMQGDLKDNLDDLNYLCRDRAPYKVCPAYAQCVVAFMDAFRDSPICPMRHLFRKSVESVVCDVKVRNFQCKVPEQACSQCRWTLAGGGIRRVAARLPDYWQGLCLDCMRTSKRQTPANNLDNDYWNHHRHHPDDDWSIGCRIDHTRNTWYFSFMGRPEVMNIFFTEQQNRRKKTELEEARAARAANHIQLLSSNQI